MVDETQIVLAFLFKRSGKTTVKESELYLPLSLELGWFTASQAHQFVQNALQQGFLQKENDHVTPSFDINSVDVPIGFKPTQTSFHIKKTQQKPDSLSQVSSDLLQTLLQHIEQHTDKSNQQLQKELDIIIKEKSVIPEVAALILARQYNVETDDSIAQVERILFKKT